MKTVDMVADNPGTWMFHCHVEDHMEAGMMAVYTIYAATPTRSCPIAFTGGDFWKHPEKFTLTVKNTRRQNYQRADHHVRNVHRASGFEAAISTPAWSSTQNHSARTRANP